MIPLSTVSSLCTFLAVIISYHWVISRQDNALKSVSPSIKRILGLPHSSEGVLLLLLQVTDALSKVLQLGLEARELLMVQLFFVVMTIYLPPQRLQLWRRGEEKGWVQKRKSKDIQEKVRTEIVKQGSEGQSKNVNSAILMEYIPWRHKSLPNSRLIKDTLRSGGNMEKCRSHFNADSHTIFLTSGGWNYFYNITVFMIL